MTQELLEAQKGAEQAKTEALAALSTAQSIVINTADDYEKAGRYFKKLRDMKREIQAKKDSIIKPLKSSVKKSIEEIEALFEPSEQAIDKAVAALEPPMVGFKQAEARRIAAAEEATRKEREAAEAVARAKAKEEEAKLQKAHEDAEAARKAAEEMAEDDPLGAALAEEEAREKESEAAQAFEATQTAIREAAAVNVPVIFVPKAASSGTSFRTNWKWEVEDESQIPRELMMPNDVAIGAIVRTQKDKTKIAGIRVFAENKIGG